jgi:hypothetical protein
MVLVRGAQSVNRYWVRFSLYSFAITAPLRLQLLLVSFVSAR